MFEGAGERIGGFRRAAAAPKVMRVEELSRHHSPPALVPLRHAEHARSSFPPRSRPSGGALPRAQGSGCWATTLSFSGYLTLPIAVGMVSVDWVWDEGVEVYPPTQRQALVTVCNLEHGSRLHLTPDT